MGSGAVRELPSVARSTDPPAPSISRGEAVTPPASSLLLGHVPELRADPLGALLRWNRAYGDVVRVKARHWTYILNHPDDVKHVLVSHQSRYHKGEVLRLGRRVFGQGLLASEEPLHLVQRHLMQPAFHRETLRGYGETMVAKTLELVARWPKEGEVDVASEMMRLTLGIAAKTLFGLDDVAETEALALAVDDAQQWIFLRQNSAVPLPDWVPTPVNFRYRRAVGVMDRLVYRIIQERRRHHEGATDLLTMLLEARDEHGHGMEDAQLRDEALTLLLAGHETTANGLSWTLYLLSKNPQALARTRSELQEVLGGRTPTVADLPRLRYTEMVFSEAIRLYPPAWIVPRESIEEDPLPSGATIPRGAQVVVSPWSMQRDREYFP
ncbi:MAG: cytochrome P450, partial [Euryarchaeota archaeon]|nr:cytochrome P450 [Euryarchaeota archaeon]